MLLKLLAIALLGMAPTESAPTGGTTSQPATELPPVNIFQSAIFVCGDYIYKNDVDMVFPPADASLQNIVNDTLYKIVLSQSIGNFCDKLDSYTKCVETLVALNYSQVDTYVKDYIDFKNFNSTLRYYCANTASVIEQFDCTKLLTESHSCPNGGIVGLVKSVPMAIRNGVSRQQFCTELQASIRCRVDKQLTPCNANYGAVMEGVYRNLTYQYCQRIYRQPRL